MGVAAMPFVLNVPPSGIGVSTADGLASRPERDSIEERCLAVGEVRGLARDDHVVDERRRGLKLYEATTSADAASYTVPMPLPPRATNSRLLRASCFIPIAGTPSGGTRVAVSPVRRSPTRIWPACGCRQRPGVERGAVPDCDALRPEVGRQRNEIGEGLCGCSDSCKKDETC